jgi:hypothetical protein
MTSWNAQRNATFIIPRRCREPNNPIILMMESVESVARKVWQVVESVESVKSVQQRAVHPFGVASRARVGGSEETQQETAGAMANDHDDAPPGKRDGTVDAELEVGRCGWIYSPDGCPIALCFCTNRCMAASHAKFAWGSVLHAPSQGFFLERLPGVVTALQRELPDAGYDLGGLAQLLMSFLQFMEDVAGKNVRGVVVVGWGRAWGLVAVHGL